MLLVTGGCSLPSLFHPPAIDKAEGVVHQASVTAGPGGRVEILVDELGVPHVYGSSAPDLAYGLGFVHARDRLFQLLLLKHAGLGRLGELFGRDLVEEDRRLRLLSYRLDDEEQALPDEARAILAAYVDGLNEGAAHAGRSLEMQLLGLNAAPFEVRDVLAIVRLQAWDLSMDMEAELARARIVARLPSGDARRDALLVDVPTGGVPIVPLDERGRSAPAEPPVAPPMEPRVEPPADPPADPPVEPPVEPPAQTSSKGPSLRELLSSYVDARGSNSWVVSGKLTKSKKPILCNDPHLTHRAPGVMYLVHLEGAGVRVTGATLPGVPAILIGHTPDVAWGLTTSYADVQDLVRLKLSTTRPDHYVLDGRELPFVRHVEQFRAGGEVLLTESWRTSDLGPVLEGGFASEMEPGETYALLWSSFDPDASAGQVLAFWELARATTMREAQAAIGQMAASQNVVFASSDGSIGYRLSGKIPLRRSTEPIWLPRDGSTSAAGWSGYVPYAELPHLDNPASGVVVTANQRVVDEGHPAWRTVGGYAVSPHRALRIHERLEQALAQGPVDAEALLAIQQDVVSVEARALAPVLGAACPREVAGQPNARAAAFCAAVRDFDGSYTVESSGALPFTVLLAALHEEALSAHLAPDVARQLMTQPFVVMAFEQALLGEERGVPSPLLDDLGTPAREGVAGFVARAAPRALGRLVDEFGAEPSQWTWGKVHTLTMESPLARVPGLGLLFAGTPRPQAGWNRAPRAEGGLPVRTGAVLRFVAEMTDPIAARMVSDFGNNGHVGHQGFGNFVERWERGDPVALPFARDDVERSAKGRLVLVPRAEHVATTAR